MDAIVFGVALAFLLAASIQDVLKRKVSNFLVVGMVLSGLLLGLAFKLDLFNVFLLSGICLLVFFVFYLFGLFGAGDAKLFCATAFFVGLLDKGFFELLVLFGVSIVFALCYCLVVHHKLFFSFLRKEARFLLVFCLVLVLGFFFSFFWLLALVSLLLVFSKLAAARNLFMPFAPFLLLSFLFLFTVGFKSIEWLMALK